MRSQIRAFSNTSELKSPQFQRTAPQLSRLGDLAQPRFWKLFHMEIPMENEKRSSQLFYLIIALIVLGFIANIS